QNPLHRAHAIPRNCDAALVWDEAAIGQLGRAGKDPGNAKSPRARTHGDPGLGDASPRYFKTIAVNG
ncbi:hypothetical protein ACSLVQ_29315, partial [Klebsiella pneumoniae]|uniref:hypothetical protein n=1 Tax=Klebsiella pneumoniae TaxID=573 RepID=UPI003EE3FD3A